MPLYKFKVYLDDTDEVFRVIELKPGQKFLDFHDAILKSFAFDNKHDASFFMSDDTWKKGQEITKSKKGELPLFKDSKLNAFINDPHQKIIFIYEQEDVQWYFHCELNGIIMDVDITVDYPNIVKSVGKPPKQYGKGKKVGENLEEDEFDYLTKNLIAGDVSEEEIKEHDGFSDDPEAVDIADDDDDSDEDIDIDVSDDDDED
jgi:hypothetical protein